MPNRWTESIRRPRHGRGRLARWAGIAAAGLLLALGGAPARADDTNYFVIDDLTFDGQTVNFDTTFDGTPLTAPKLFEDASVLRNLYFSLGIYFGGGQAGGGGVILHQDSAFGVGARSGTNFLAFNREAVTQDNDTPADPLVVTFDFPVKSVFLYVAGGYVSQNFRLNAYDRAGNMVDSDSVAAQGYQKLSVASDTGFTRLVLSRDRSLPGTTVTIPQVVGSAGAQVSIPVQVDGQAASVAAAQVAVQFGDVMTVTDVSQITPGPLLKNGIVEADLSIPGKVEVSGASGQGTDGPGTMLVITGTVKPNVANGNYPIHLLSAQVSSLFGQAIPTTLVDGVLKVGPAAVCGDLDGEGTLTVSDAVNGLRIVVGLDSETPAQTLSACGYSIDVTFVVQILRVVVGLQDSIVPAGGG